MPTYVCTTRRGLLDVDMRKAAAAAISRAHSEATGAPAFFVQVIFDEKDTATRFLGGEPSDRHIWIRGDIRAGRTMEQRAGLMRAIMRDVAAVADVALTDVWVYLCELAPTDMIEYGHVLPQPGEERAWFEALPEPLRAYLQGLGSRSDTFTL